MNTNKKMTTLPQNQSSGHQPSLKPEYTDNGQVARQPPRNSVVATAETVTMLMYSARKKKANLIELYSVWKPPTSSVSASGRSKGARFVSPTAATPYRMNDTGSTQKYQWLVCEATIPLVARVAEYRKTGALAM